MRVENRELKQEVRRAARGDEEAAAYLFDTYHPRVFRYALAKLGAQSDAEDVAAETFAVVLRELPRFKWKGAGFEAWLFRIAANLVVDQVRRGGKEWAAPDGFVGADMPYDRTPERQVLEREMSREIAEMLEHLTAEQREVLLLRFAAGLDTNEAAEAMGRKPNAVRQLQFRALAALREQMQGEVRT
jgi:RNA polymerase sigma-70 factor (ECF subfamily)